MQKQAPPPTRVSWPGSLGLLLGASCVLVLAVVAVRIAERVGWIAGRDDLPVAGTPVVGGAVVSWDATPPAPTPAAPPAPTPAAPPATDPPGAATPTVPARRVGIIPGHWGYDTGAVCPDGRQEVDVTRDVALRVQALLEFRGFEVDLLHEHGPNAPQPPMQGYQGAAVVSIHADSCDFPGVSGFKIARWTYSSMPEVEDRLVDCLYREYAAATLMDRHDDSISEDMTNYYAFREIGVDTPAAIIELGFLSGDRYTLDNLRYEMALGVANGVSCFVDGGR